MNRFAIYVLVIAAALLIASVPSHAQINYEERWEHGFGEGAFFNYERYMREDAVALRARWQRIEEENRNANLNEWAGDYQGAGEVSQYVLRWSPRAGFAYIYIYTCIPEVRWLEHGSVSASPRLIQMRAENRPRGDTPRSSVTNYLPVRWGERHYLILETRVGEFYSHVAGYGQTPVEWTGEFFVRDGDGDKPVSGMPILPPGYERFVRYPIEATIMRVGRSFVRNRGRDRGQDYYDSVTPITLNVGTANGVRRTMDFHLIGSRHAETIEIRRVGRNLTQAVIIRPWMEGRGEVREDFQTRTYVPYIPITTGSRLTTSFDLYHTQTFLRR